MTTGKRQLLSKGKGYLSAAGPQARFIVFLLSVLIAYTFILLLFRKMAEFLQLPLFFPVALLILVIFIGVVGTMYSHKFIGPLARIRRTIEQLACGDTSISLRVRESDDPLLKDLVASVSLLCEHNRSTFMMIQDATRGLAEAVNALKEKALKEAGEDDIRTQMEDVLKRQEMLEQAVRSFKKA